MPKGNIRALENYISDFICSDDAKRIVDDSETVNEWGFDSWSFKKLIFLDFYIRPFLDILKKNGYKCYYIDLYAGSGASCIKGTGAKTIGSPLISLLKGVRRLKNSQLRRFDKWFFVEKSDSHSRALKRRTEKAISILTEEYHETLSPGKDVIMFHGDCCDRINDIVEIIMKDSDKVKAAILVFVDPYNLSQFNWDTLKRISEFSHVDVIFNLPTGAYRRNKLLYKEIERHLPNLSKREKEKLRQTDDCKYFSSMFAKGISKVAKCNIYYYDDGVIVKNRTNTEMFRVTLFTRSSIGAGIAKSIIGRLNNYKTRDIDKEVQKITGKISSLDKFL